jgi:hypothetical protein
VNSSGLKQCPVAESGEHCNEPPGFVEGGDSPG